MQKTVRKAVFPVAGMGTRFLPATKANPKEMLPIVDKPLIQYAVEEAIAAGVKELIFVTNHTKRAIEDHFGYNFELETKLHRDGKTEFLDIVSNVLPNDVSCIYVRQHEALGLGHAVLCAKNIVGDEPFAVILADDLIDADEVACLRELVDLYDKTQSSILAVQHVPGEGIEKYGVIDFEDDFKGHVKLKGVVEKPHHTEAPSQYGIVGRYILTPAIFNLLEQTEKGRGGEIQLTDAIAQLLNQEAVYGAAFSGKRYDCGSKLGYLEATLEYALKHSEVADDFRKLLLDLIDS